MDEVCCVFETMISAEGPGTGASSNRPPMGLGSSTPRRGVNSRSGIGFRIKRLSKGSER